MIEVLFYAVVTLVAFSVCELVKLAALDADQREWHRAIEEMREAIEADDYERADRIHEQCRFFDKNLNRRLKTPWIFPSAWKNYPVD